jgi:predicted component of type VI protein secretion system
MDQKFAAFQQQLQQGQQAQEHVQQQVLRLAGCTQQQVQELAQQQTQGLANLTSKLAKDTEARQKLEVVFAEL